MKKRSILVLLVVLVATLVLGITGCKKSVYIPKIPEYATIQTANDMDEVLKDNGILVEVSFNAGAQFAQGAKLSMYYSKAEDGSLMIDSKIDAASESYYTSLVHGDVYSIAHGYEMLEICPEADHTACLAESIIIDLGAFEIDGEVIEEGGAYVFDAKGTKEFAEDASFVVDKETLLITSATYKAYDANSEVVQDLALTYTYGSNVEWAGYAYDALTSVENEDDLSIFELRINPESSRQQIRNYSVKKGVDIQISSDLNGKAYYFYKNVGCTKDIESLTEILAEYNDVRIYATDSHVEISFAFVLSENDVEDFNDKISSYVDLATNSSDYDEIEYARELMEDKIEFFVHQYYMGQIQYYLNIEDAEGTAKFDLANEAYNNAYVAYIDAYKSVYELENDYSTWFFEDWSEEDLAIFEKDNEAISELEQRNSEIEKEYNALRQDNNWSANVATLYEEFVANNQQIARLNGYANAYEYYSKDVYQRNYTAEERQALVENIKKYVVSYEQKAKNLLSKAQSALTDSEKKDYTAIVYSDLSSLENPYIGGYINSYNSSLKEKMSAIYDKKAIQLAKSTKSMGTAYANYSGYYEEAFTFFGTSYQDILTFIHELGHYVSFSSYPAGMPYDFAETHSQSNEWMLLYYLNGKIKTKIHNLLVYSNLSSALGVILRGMLVDEFEYRVYTAETPYTADQFEDVMVEALAAFGMPASYLKFYYQKYVQKVTILSPCYYLNYVTSAMASLGCYTLAANEGYEVAQEVYRKLQEDCDISMPYSQIVASIGLPSPFVEESYQMMVETFFPQ